MAKIWRPRLGLCHGTQTRFRRPLMQVFIISILNSPYWSLRNVSTDVTKKNKMRCECKRPCSSFLLFSFSHCEQAIHSIERSWDTDEVEIFLEEREVAFLSPIKLGDKNATSLCSKIISFLLGDVVDIMGYTEWIFDWSSNSRPKRDLLISTIFAYKHVTYR